MSIYFILLMWSLLSILIFKFKAKDKIKNIIYLLVNFIPLILVSGLREESVGTDTLMYNQLFKHFTTSNFGINNSANFDVEWGYIFFNKIAGVFFDDSQSIIFLMSFFTLTGFAYFIYKNSVCIWQSTFIFIGMFFLEPMNSIRQSFAVMILCCGYIFLVKREIIKYFSCIIVASLFHRSALVFLFFLPLFLFKRKMHFLIYLSFTVGMVVLFRDNLWIVFQIAFDKYLAYVGTEYIYPKEIGMGIYKIILFFILIFIGTVLYARGKFDSMEERSFYISSIYILCACLATMGQYEIAIFYRFIFCFSIYMCTLVPLVLKKLGNIKKILIPGMILIVFFYLYHTLLTNPDFLYC